MFNLNLTFSSWILVIISAILILAFIVLIIYAIKKNCFSKDPSFDSTMNAFKSIQLSLLINLEEDKVEKYYSHSYKERRVDNLKEWLDAIKKNNGTLSESLKIMVTILAAYDPTEFALKEYHEFVMNEDFFKQIQESDLCNPIKLLVSEFKDWMTPKPTDLNALQILMDLLKSEGYHE